MSARILRHARPDVVKAVDAYSTWLRNGLYRYRLERLRRGLPIEPHRTHVDPRLARVDETTGLTVLPKP